MAQSKEEFFETLGIDGVAKVKANLATHCYPSHEKPWVIEWLERSNEATSAEQLALARAAAAEAREANAIAKSARKIAIASVITAIAIAIVGTAVAVIVPHYWR